MTQFVFAHCFRNELPGIMMMTVASVANPKKNAQRVSEDPAARNQACDNQTVQDPPDHHPMKSLGLRFLCLGGKAMGRGSHLGCSCSSEDHLAKLRHLIAFLLVWNSVISWRFEEKIMQYQALFI